MRSLAASKTGAAWSSVWAKMSETKIGLPAQISTAEFSVLRFSDVCSLARTTSTNAEVLRSHDGLACRRFPPVDACANCRSPAHAGQGGNFFRRALRVAAGDHDLGVGILAMNAADCGASVLIGGGRYGAGIEHHDCASPACGASIATLLELAFDGRAVGLGGAASEICYVESGHNPMLSQASVTGRQRQLRSGTESPTQAEA